MTSPSLTVLMAVYNGARDLSEAVDSILAQDFTDFEFLIIDLTAINPTQQKQARACCGNIFVQFGENENFRLRKNTNNLLIFEN